MGVEAQSSPPLTGKMLGPYRILSRLAVGGMAELWLALTAAKGGSQKVVLKTMLPGVAESREFVRMFQTEATMGSRLCHPNLVRVLDYGRLADRYFIAMEYIDGLTLRQVGLRFRELGRRFPPRMLLSIAIEVCRGLHTAHELRDRGGLVQFVHRDVSPENIMITRQGTAKLIDFGAASTLRIRPTTGRFVGKFRYVSPERLEGKKEDRRCDIYSLGVILYEYLTGRRPFEGDDLAMMARILEGPPRPPREVVADLPEALDATLLKALALRPEERHPTAAALAAELTPLLDSLAFPGTVDDERRVLEQAFDHPLDEATAADAATPTETDAKTVEMEVDALREVLSRTREEPTVIKRMRLDRRGRPISVESRERAAARPAARNGGRSSVQVQPHVQPLSDVLAAGDETQPLPGRRPRPVAVSARLADALLLADALPLSAEAGAGRPVERLPDPVDAFSAVPPQPPVIAPAPAPLAEETPDPDAKADAEASAESDQPTTVAPSWLFDRRASSAGNSPFPDAPSAAAVAGWFDISRPSEPGAPALDRPPANGVLAEADEGDERRRPPLPEAVRCFDRGLSLLQDKLFAAALEQWERATLLDPENRMYQVNVKRLRQRVSSSNPSSLNPRSVLHEHEKRESQ